MPTSIAITVVDAELYYGTVGGAATTLANTCSDVTLKMNKNEAKANSRRSKYGGVVPTITDLEADVTFPLDKADPHQAIFRNAAINDTPISVLIKGGAGIVAPTVDVFVTGMEEGEPLEGVETVKFTVKRAAMGNADRTVAWA
jgi:hypothetical protein